MRHITIWIYEKCIASGIAGPIDVFVTANIVWSLHHQRSGALFAWRLESLEGLPVRTASAITLQPDGPIGSAHRADAVLLPGMAIDGVKPLLHSLEKLRPVLPSLRRHYEQGAFIAANCSANFLLAETGLLDGRRATTHWCLSNVFSERYPRVQVRADEILTEQDRLLCSGAATAYLDLALRMVEIFAGERVAVETAKLLLIDSHRTSQAPYRMSAVQDHFAEEADLMISRALRWLHKNLSKSFNLATLARHLSVSERTLTRHFNRSVGRSPGACLQSLRIEHAKRLLETTALRVEVIGNKVGYADTSFFRRLFKREAGVTPSDYRERFAARSLPAPPSLRTRDDRQRRRAR